MISEQPIIDSNKKTEIKHLLVFLFVVAIAIFPFTKVFGHSTLTLSNQFLVSRLKIWIALFLLYIYSLKIEKRAFLLWKEKSYLFVNYVLSILSTYFLLVVCLIPLGIFLKLTHTNTESTTLNKIILILKANKWMVPIVCATAGVTEELLFRGYLIPRLENVFKNSKIAILVSSILFGLMHFGYGTIGQLLGPFIIGLVFAIHYYKFRNIKILIITHFLWDFITLMIKLKTT